MDKENLIFLRSNSATEVEQIVLSSSNPENITATQEPTGDNSTKARRP